MRKLFIILNLLFFSVMCFAQQSASFKIIGKIPQTDSKQLYQIQVGAFKIYSNAETVFERLSKSSFNPKYEKYQDFTRVIIAGVNAKDVANYLERLKNLGFKEVLIRGESTDEAAAPAVIPVSTAVLPAASKTEIGYRTIKVGETKNITSLANDKNISTWSSSTPETVTINSNGDIVGKTIGNAFIMINENEYISVAVVPAESFYIVSESQASLLPPESATGNEGTTKLTEYKTEPTFRLAYKFNNKGEHKGASGENGGIDILGRGENYKWLWTTFYQGGWFYDLNGVRSQMVDGYQKDMITGVELTVKPEFVYDNGVPYLQLRNILHNTNNHAVTEQRFGASADVMIHENDDASLVHTSYGAYMTDSESNPSLELMCVVESGDGITPVDTLWLGTWGAGTHLNHIYDDERSDIRYKDSAIGFSYKNINLEAGETKEFIVRFTLARNEDQ
jgi:hypothetical protein